jgi:hypothetical protein
MKLVVGKLVDCIIPHKRSYEKKKELIQHQIVVSSTSKALKMVLYLGRVINQEAWICNNLQLWEFSTALGAWQLVDNPITEHQHAHKMTEYKLKDNSNEKLKS